LYGFLNSRLFLYSQTWFSSIQTVSEPELLHFWENFVKKMKKKLVYRAILLNFFVIKTVGGTLKPRPEVSLP